MEPGALAQIQYTGGTTGIPKGVMLTHRNVVVNTMQGRFWVRELPRGKRSVSRRGAVVPLLRVEHVPESGNCNRLQIILLPRFHADEAVKAIQQHRVTIMSGVPMMFSMMTDSPNVRRYDLHSIRVCLCGASPLPAEVQDAFERLSGVKISEGYGLTEAGPTTHCNPIERDHPPGSMGLLSGHGGEDRRSGNRAHRPSGPERPVN